MRTFAYFTFRCTLFLGTMDRLPDFRGLARDRLLALMALLVLCASKPTARGINPPTCPNCEPRISGGAAGPVCLRYADFPARNADGTVLGVKSTYFIAGNTPGRLGDWVDEYAVWLAERWAAERLGVAVPPCPLQDNPPGLLAYLGNAPPAAARGPAAARVRAGAGAGGGAAAAAGANAGAGSGELSSLSPVPLPAAPAVALAETGVTGATGVFGETGVNGESAFTDATGVFNVKTDCPIIKHQSPAYTKIFLDGAIRKFERQKIGYRKDDPEFQKKIGQDIAKVNLQIFQNNQCLQIEPTATIAPIQQIADNIAAAAAAATNAYLANDWLSYVLNALSRD